MTAILDAAGMRRALRALRHRRRVQRLRHLDWIDAIYRAYVVGISLIAALMTLAFLVGDATVSASTIVDVRRHGAAICGAVVALLIGLGLRSGSHGGPLAFEAADVHHVMLAPIDRGLVVRSAAYRQLRGVMTTGAVVGALIGVTAGPRFSDAETDIAGWVVGGIAFGLTAALVTWASALVGSSTRLTSTTASVIAGVLALWSVADVLNTVTSSPLTMIGHLAVWPLDASWTAIPGVAVVLVFMTFGFRNAGRTSLEPALHRAQLVRSLRFAATIQDLRAIITLRRQLSHENSRHRPWLRLNIGTRTGRAGWRRDWRGILRWPGARLTRIVALTLIAGAACAAALRGTTPLFAIAVVASYIVTLDTVEGLAEEVDHPDRSSGVPVEAGRLYVAHLAAPMVVIGGLGAIGLGAGFGVAALIPAGLASSISPLIGLAVVAVLTFVAPVAGALSVYLGRPDRNLALVILNPGLAAAQQVAPVVVLALAFLPLLVAAKVTEPADAVRLALQTSVPAVGIAFGIRAYLRSRQSSIT